MKKFVETLPTLTSPIHGEVLVMYLAASTESINAALFAKREKGQQEGCEDIFRHIRDDSNKETPKDFLIDAPPEDNRKEVERKTDTKLEDTKLSCEWKLYTDGASSSDGSGAGLMLIDPKGIYAAKQPAIREYLQRKKETLRRFRSYTIEHIRRNQNKKADALSKLASMTFEHLTKEVLVEVLTRRSIEEKEVLQVETKEEESWMTPTHEYLLSGLLPEDPKESRKIIIKAPQYKLIKGNLYKNSFYTPFLRCIAPPKTNDVIKEIHEGSCGFNTEPHSMVFRMAKQGYYWPSMHIDVSRVIQDCEKCKEQSVVKKRAETGAIASGNAWPFSHWGVNILGPLSTAPRGLKFLAVAIEHSTKWIEAKPLTTISARHVEIFVWDYVVCRFGVPYIISLKDDKTLLRDNQEETPFSLTYGSEAIIPIVKSIVAKDDRGRTKEMTKRKESKEVASIEKAYYQNELQRYHNKRKSPFNYKVRDFVLLLQNNTENPQVWQGPHMIREVYEGELYKIIDASNHLLIQTAKGTNLRKFYM
ncbi:reverse transcriptase domain-containing protein [Tanacetum coccineum]